MGNEGFTKRININDQRRKQKYMTTAFKIHKKYPGCIGTFPDCVGYELVSEDERTACKKCPWRRRDED